MARKLKIIEDADVKKYGIRITYSDGKSGWIVGSDCDYLLFDSEPEAARALKRMKKDDRYSWNCTAEVVPFNK